MNGIDTMEEYKENKAILARERKILESKLSFLQKKPVTKEEVMPKLQQRIRNVYDIITNDDFSIVQKNDAVKSIIEKIVFNKETDTAEIYYYYL